MSYTLPLDRVDPANTERVGGKAASLGALLAAGFPVPGGFVLTTEAFQLFVETLGLRESSTESEVRAAPMPEGVERELLQAALALGDVALAVRSSAVGEDATDASFAGQYESVLDVRGPEALTAAVRRCWASAFSPRLLEYRKRRQETGPPRVAVVVQRMLEPTCAGVAFTANPVSGDREETLVSAVLGLGDRLVSGEAVPDEWLVRGDRAERRRAGEEALDAERACAVAALARSVEARFGCPQDTEWALCEDKLWLLQARPITALPDATEWRAPLPGGWTRTFRFGEWLPEPLTPLFETWLLPRLHAGFNGFYRRQSGICNVPPDHVLINGWYFGSLNFVPSPLGLLWQLFTRFLPKLLSRGRRAFAILPPLHAHCIELFIDDWRKLVARYRADVEAASSTLADTPSSELPAVIDRLADLAGEYFGMVSLVSGYAWKVEVPLAEFYQRHLEPRLGGTHQDLLQGLFVPARSSHDVQSLDWFRPTIGESLQTERDAGAEARRSRLERSRLEAEQRVRSALRRETKLLARFENLLSLAQRFAPIRDEQVSQFTLAWPVMRRALTQIGRALVQAGRLHHEEEVFFLSQTELRATPDDAKAGSLSGAIAERRATWERQCRLAPPISVGEPPAMLKSIFAKAEAPFRRAAAGALVSGFPASPGRASGPVCIVRRVEDFQRFRDGDVLVAPATMPAWTPLFPRASAVVTDVGSIIAHAALVAREYGIPAVVGTGNATAALSDGQHVVVDGTRGVVLGP